METQIAVDVQFKPITTLDQFIETMELVMNSELIVEVEEMEGEAVSAKEVVDRLFNIEARAV